MSDDAQDDWSLKIVRRLHGCEIDSDGVEVHNVELTNFGVRANVPDIFCVAIKKRVRVWFCVRHIQVQRMWASFEEQGSVKDETPDLVVTKCT